MSLARKHVVIVGGSSGIGLAIARSALAAGGLVTLIARDDAKLKTANASLENRATTLSADFRDEQSIARALATVPAIDHLVLAAAVDAAWGPFAGLTRARLLRAFEGKLLGYVSSLQAALPKLAKDGSVLMVSGAASRIAMPGTAGLAAVNGAITQMAQTLSKELAPIRVNVISPGMVDTPAYDYMPAAEREAMYRGAAQKLPAGRIGKPEDLAAAALMLLENGFATGVILDIDGGIRS